MYYFCRSILVLLILFIGSEVSLASTASVLQPKEETSKLRWKRGKIEIGISSSLFSQNSNIKAGSDVAGAIERSFAAWQEAAPVEFIFVDSTSQDVSPSGFAGDGTSLITIAATPENVLFFGKDPLSLSAKTRIFFNRRGIITEADIVLNPFQQFSTDGSYGTIDLETTLRHEIGHLLGLRHSNVIGAAMYDSTGQNGLFDTKHEVQRLTDDDISAVRALYGTNESVQDCCGSIAGKLITAGRAGRVHSIWVQDITTGRIAASVSTDRSRTFRVDGLSAGRYSVFAVEDNRKFSVQKLSDVSVQKRATTSLNAKYVRRQIDFSLTHLGINGILSNSPVVLERGQDYLLIAGGAKISAGNIRISTDSPFISIFEDSVENVQYDDTVSAVSFRINIDPSTPAGQYSITASTDGGGVDVLIGAITVIEN